MKRLYNGILKINFTCVSVLKILYDFEKYENKLILNWKILVGMYLKSAALSVLKCYVQVSYLNFHPVSINSYQ